MQLLPKPIFWGGKYIVFIVVFISLMQPLYAQQHLPITKATSGTVTIKDGEVYQKDVWMLSPENQPDVYFAIEPVPEKK